MLFALLFFDYCEGFCFMGRCVWGGCLLSFLHLCSCITSILLGIVLSHPKEPSSFNTGDLCETIVHFRIQKSISNFNIFIVFTVFHS